MFTIDTSIYIMFFFGSNDIFLVFLSLRRTPSAPKTLKKPSLCPSSWTRSRRKCTTRRS